MGVRCAVFEPLNTVRAPKSILRLPTRSFTAAGLRDGQPPQGGADSGQEFRRAKGFRHEIVGAGIQRGDLILFGVPNREHDDSDAGSRSDLPACGQATHARHIDVEKYKIRMELAKLDQSLLTGLCIIDFVPGFGKRAAHETPHLRLVIDNKDPAAHSPVYTS